MKIHLTIFILFQSFFSFSQQGINSISLDSLGHLKWEVTYMTPTLNLEIQRKVEGKWVTINRTGHQVSYIQKVGSENIHPPSELMVVKDSCTVPLNRGSNIYRIVMTSPARIESKELFVKLWNGGNQHRLFGGEDGYIRFDKGVFFCINDATGKEIRKFDSGKMINTTALKPGLYYIIVYPNVYEFYKK